VTTARVDVREAILDAVDRRGVVIADLLLIVDHFETDPLPNAESQLEQAHRVLFSERVVRDPVPLGPCPVLLQSAPALARCTGT